MSNENDSLTGLWTILRTLQWTADYFRRQGVPSARATAELLLSHCLACERIDLYLRHDQPLQADELARFKALIQRRQQREPDAYIIGRREFWSLSFQVNPDVLIPRPETECLVETALARQPTHDPIEVLELGTGSGAICVALAHERPSWRIKATDISSKALNVARRNADHLLGDHPLSFIEGSWFEPLGTYRHFFDLVVSNPPYIVRKDLEDLAPEVSRFEPALALDGGDDGLSCLKHIIQTAPHYLKPEGVLILEIGHDQAPAVTALGRHAGAYRTIQIAKDYGGRDRVACFQLKKYCESNRDLLMVPDF
jgi:release factor glutamine methyltransferase